MEIRASATPFRHWVIRGLVEEHFLLGASEYLPGPDWDGWEARYSNDCESRKRTCRDVASVSQGWSWLFQRLESPEMVAELSGLSGIAGLRTDPTRHGGGIHVTDPLGYLQCHLDYARHPTLNLERRLNLVLFANSEWREEWGGAFELCDEMGNVAKRIYPEPGLAVLWEPSDLAYHGTQQVAAAAPPRVTAAVYYLSPPRPGVSRRRALFIPKRG